MNTVALRAERGGGEGVLGDWRAVRKRERQREREGGIVRKKRTKEGKCLTRGT